MLNDRRVISGLVGAAAIVFAACGGGSDAVPTDSAGSSTPTTNDPRDGAFVKNEGRSDPPVGGTDPAATDGGPTTLATNPEVAEVADQPATTAPASTVDTTENSSTGGDGAATDGLPALPVSEPGSAIIRIGAIEYAFAIASCDIGPDGAVVEGSGILPTGAEYDATISYELVDVDDDGVNDEFFELSIDHRLADGGDGLVPELYTSNQETDVAVTLSGRHLAGTGSIVDFNGVAFPEDQPAPMSFDAQCK